MPDIIPTINYSYIVGDQKVTVFFISDSSYSYNYKYSTDNENWIPFTPNGTNRPYSSEIMTEQLNYRAYHNFRSVIITGLQNGKSYTIKIKYDNNINNNNVNVNNSTTIVLSNIIPKSLKELSYSVTKTGRTSLETSQIRENAATNESFALRMLTTTNNFSSKSHLSCLKKFSFYQKELPRIDPFLILSGNPSIIFDDNYYYITFVNNGNITFLSSLNATINDFNIICVGGGGGGGGSSNRQAGNPKSSTGGGGGGAAAARLNTTVSNTSYSITIGTGGGGGPGNLSGINGTDSSFKSGITNVITSGGGGRGAGHFEGVVGGSSGTVTASSGTIYGGDGGNGGSGFEDNIPPIIATNGTNGSQFILPNGSNLYFSGGGGGGGGDASINGDGGGAGNGIGGIVGANSIIDGQSATKYGGGGGGGGMNDVGNFSTGGQGGPGIVILYFKYIPTFETIFTGPAPNCVHEDNVKVYNNSSDVDQTLTKTQRAVNAIKFSTGGRIIYGNANGNPYSTGMSFLGRTEGQPGGIIGPLRNRF